MNIKMNSNLYTKTGEVGFCPTCGTLTEVVVLPDDRLQALIGRAMERTPQLAGADEPADHLQGALHSLETFWASAVDDYLDGDWGELRENLIELQCWLSLAGEAIGELLDEPVDLMRLAVERLEEANGGRTAD